MKQPKIYAFTLAEVLITLGIIGVVAAMTIPTLINNYQKTQYVTQLKKAYSEFTQAFKQMANDNGCIDDLQCTGLFANTIDDTTLGNAFIAYFKTVKNCKTATDQDCWPTATSRTFDKSDGSNDNFNTSPHYKFVTAEGMSVVIYNRRQNCDSPTTSTGRTGDMATVCAEVYVDVNGLNPPNSSGRDTFYFFVTNKRGALLYPYGGADDKWGWASINGDMWWSDDSGNQRLCYSGQKWGYYCAGRIIEEGWKMNY